MDRINEGIFPSMRVSEAVKFRPSALEIFRRIGCDAWKEGGEFIAVVCQSRGLRTQDFLQELSTLPIPVPTSPWEELPAHFLIDYLTVEHRQLLHSDFPAFRCLLEIPFRKASGGELFRILLDGLMLGKTPRKPGITRRWRTSQTRFCDGWKTRFGFIADWKGTGYIPSLPGSNAIW